MLSGKRASALSRSQASASEALDDFRSADLLDHSAYCMTKSQILKEDGVPTTLSVGLLAVLLENAFAASRTKAQMNPPVPTPQIAEADP